MDIGTSKNYLPSEEGSQKLNYFFANQLFNSTQATDDLIRGIEKANDEALARKALARYQAHYSTLERPWEHVTFMYGLGLIYMHFNAYDWAVKAFREVLYVQPNFDRARDVHCRLGLIFKALGRHKLSDKHFKIARHDLRPKQVADNPYNTTLDSDNTNHNNSCKINSIVSSNNSDVVSKNSTQKLRRIDVNLISDNARPPHRFSPAPPYPPLPSSKLNPSPPFIFIESKKDLISKKLQECCMTNSITVMRNISSVLKLDLGLFSTKTLLETNPDHPVIVHSYISPIIKKQINAIGNDTIDQKSSNWKQVCQRMSSTISRYATYQAATFRESLQEEQDSKSNGPKSTTKESGTDSNESPTPNFSKQSNHNNTTPHNQNTYNNNDLSQSSVGSQCNTNYKGSNKKVKLESTPELKYIKSADKIDLSEECKWRPQLHELNKMPSFIRCISACNMLTHVGKAIPGLNAIEMSMHVPGCRVFGQKVQNNFCSTYLNIGPGDYEWHAVPADHGCVLAKLCNKNGLELEDNTWWPKIEDLQKSNIPVYKFIQRPGDLVWINFGTIFWVQATGWCNNIHWNVGPLGGKQFKAAAESFELDKFIFRKSQIPMIQLTWNIVINITVIFDNDLYKQMVDVLARSLEYCTQVKDLVQQAKQEITSLSKGPIYGKFCSICDGEVFNIHFVRKSDDCIFCVECACRADQTFERFNIKQDYDLEYLLKLYETFTETRARILSKRQELKQHNHEKPSVSQSIG